MGVTFDAAARRAIDRAMGEAERRNHSTLLPAHLVHALLTDTQSGGVGARLGEDGVPLARAWGEALDLMLGGGAGAALVSRAVEDVLQQASVIAQRRNAAAVTAEDLIAACAEGDPSRAAAVGVSAGARPQERPSHRQEPTAREPHRAFRTGIGYDSHRFAAPGPMILAGVTIPSDVRLDGHSDGDAVAHAVTDAVLGAAAAGDIGEFFPDHIPENAGRNSLDMLRATVTLVGARGWAVEAVDVTVIAERPRIGPYRARMQASLAAALGLTAEAVGMKGKSNEGMGWIGRGEGLACIAVATLASKRSDH
ncbi:MAG: hypothetical protein NVS1B4_05840 [Gemmatimonadaceae bacterium]